MFNPRDVQCPHCKKTKLRVIEENEKVIAYMCADGCGSVFDTGLYTDFKKDIIYYLAKKHNPDYLARLDSEDLFENMKKAEELDQKGVPVYTNIYVIGSREF